jgi:ATP-binding cassette subfamily B protein
MIVLPILQSVILLPSFYFIKLIFDKNIPDKDLFGLLENTAFLILLILINSFFLITYKKLFITKIKNIVKDIQEKIITRIINSSKSYIEQKRETDLVARVVDDADRTDRMIDSVLSILLPQICIFIIGLIILLYYNLIIGSLAIILGFLGFIIHRYLKKNTLSIIQKYITGRENLANYVQFIPGKWILFNMRNAHKTEIKEAKNYINKFINNSASAAKSGWRLKIGNETFIGITTILLVLVGSLQVIFEQTSLGTIFGLYYLIGTIRKSSSAIQSQWMIIKEGEISLERIYNFLDESISKEHLDNKNPSPIINTVILENIFFHYHVERSILNNVSITIKMNETVLISGMNGTGKSTLINLILGFYKPCSGNILINGFNYHQFNLNSIRAQIGYLPQHQILIEGTIRENIFYGLPNSNQDIQLPDTLVQQFLSGFNKGLETQVSKLGKNLSKGQIQRISILRCLILKPKILLLDEPTNHLDVEIIEALITQIKAMKNIAIIIISHSDILNNLADVFYTIDKGELSKK